MSEKKSTTERIVYFSILQIFASFSVVMLHCNGVIWKLKPGFYRLWITANFIECFFYPAVPIFFMISGAVLMDYLKKYDTKTFFKKRFLKTVLPFLVWSILAVFYAKYRKGENVMNNGVKGIISGIMTNKYMAIYWFFYPQFAIYLSMPVLTRIQDKIKASKYAIALGFVMVSVVPLCFALAGVSYNQSLKPGIISNYLIFVFLGYYLNQVQLSKKKRFMIYIAGIFGFLLQFAGTMYVSQNHTEMVTTLKGYANLPCFLHSIALFVLFKNINWGFLLKHNITKKIVFHFSACSFGVYLIHYYFIMEASKTLHIPGSSIVWRTLGAVCVYFASVMIVTVIKKIPVLNRIVP